MLNPRTFYNSRPDGFGAVEVAEAPSTPDAPRRFVPLMRTDLAGRIGNRHDHGLRVTAQARQAGTPDTAGGRNRPPLAVRGTAAPVRRTFSRAFLAGLSGSAPAKVPRSFRSAQIMLCPISCHSDQI